MHATMRIGNATLEIDEAHGSYQPKPCHLHVYVCAQRCARGPVPLSRRRTSPITNARRA